LKSVHTVKKKRRRKKMRIPLSQDEIIKVAGKFNGKCAKCGNTNSLQIHHIIPIRKGGTNEINKIKKENGKKEN